MAVVECLTYDEALRPWQELMAGAYRHDVWQSYQWAGLEKNVNGNEPLFLVVRNGEQIVGGQLVIKRGVLGVLSGYETAGGPVYQNGYAEEVFESILTYLEQASSRAFYQTLRPQAPHEWDAALQRRGFRKSEAYTFLLNLTKGEEQVWGGLESNTRNKVRKSAKVGVEVRDGATWEEWEAFDALQQQHHGEKGIPPVSKAALRYLFEHMLPARQCKLFTAHLEGRCVGGLVLVVADRAMLTLARAADSGALQASPNEAVMWEAIKWGCNHGVELHDLHDTDPREDSPLYGIHRFKAKWGAELVERSYYIKGKTYLWARDRLNNDGVVRRVANFLRQRKWA